MREYQPRWTRQENPANDPKHGTDSTDSFGMGGQTVSAVSGQHGAISQETRPRRPQPLAQSVVSGNEVSKSNETNPSHSHGEPTENRGAPAVRLTISEAVALGLNPRLTWIRVSREEVEASAPPADWDRTLPAHCAWPCLCRTLGPCPRHRSGSPCRTGGAS